MRDPVGQLVASLIADLGVSSFILAWLAPYVVEIGLEIISLVFLLLLLIQEGLLSVTSENVNENCLTA